MFKIFIITVFVIIFAAPVRVYAAESSENSAGGSSSKVFNNGFTGQKQVTDAEFKKTVDMLKERALTKKQKRIKKQVQPNEPSYDIEHLKNFTESRTAGDTSGMTKTVMIPSNAYNENGAFIPAGYYKLSCRKTDDNRYVLDLSQGQERIMSVPAYQTKQDLEQDEINFCAAEILPDGRIRLMYGSIDLNLAGYIYYK